MRVQFAFFAAALCALPAQAVDFRGKARLWLGPGFDSNVRRDFVSPGAPTQPDLFLFGLGQLDGRLKVGDWLQLTGAYDIAGRKFLLVPVEDTVVQSAQLEALAAAGKLFNLGVLGRARDRRGAGRDYTDLAAGAVVDFLPDPSIDVRLLVSAHRFLYWNRFAYSFFGPEGTLSARVRFLRRHAVSAFGSWLPRTYNARANARPGPEGSPTPTDQERTDAVMSAGVGWSYRGPFHLAAGYAYVDQTSNSWGETQRRHRFSASAGVSLPLDFTVLAAGVVQLASYPDGILLAPELTVVEDDENGSSATLKVVRPFGDHVELDLRYAFYWNQLPTNRFTYLRHVVTVGVALSY